MDSRDPTLGPNTHASSALLTGQHPQLEKRQVYFITGSCVNWENEFENVVGHFL